MVKLCDFFFFLGKIFLFYFFFQLMATKLMEPSWKWIDVRVRHNEYVCMHIAFSIRLSSNIKYIYIYEHWNVNRMNISCFTQNVQLCMSTMHWLHCHKISYRHRSNALLDFQHFFFSLSLSRMSSHPRKVKLESSSN